MAEDSFAEAALPDEEVVHDAWREAGLVPDRAVRATRATREIAGANVVERLSAQMTAMFAGLRGEFAGLRGEFAGLRADTDKLAAQTDARFKGLEAQIKVLEAQNVAIHRELASIRWLIGILLLAVVGAVITALFLPARPVELVVPAAVIAAAVENAREADLPTVPAGEPEQDAEPSAGSGADAEQDAEPSAGSGADAEQDDETEAEPSDEQDPDPGAEPVG